MASAPEPSLDDVARIARGLTKAQRAGVVSGRWDDDSSLRAGQRRMFYDLTGRGLFAHNPRARDGCFNLTPLGFSVRQHLVSQDKRGKR